MEKEEELVLLEETEEPKKYFINIEWFERNKRSFRVVAERRFCPSCQSKIGTQTEERVPTIEPKTGRVVYQTQTVPFGSNPMAVIRGCCARERNYITADMPVMEAIFRVFLMSGNQPMDVETIRDELGQWFPLTSRPHGYAAEVLTRLIEADTYYGIREFNPPPID